MPHGDPAGYLPRVKRNRKKRSKLQDVEGTKIGKVGKTRVGFGGGMKVGVATEVAKGLGALGSKSRRVGQPQPANQPYKPRKRSRSKRSA